MKVIPAKVGKHDFEMECPACEKIWSQPDWYRNFDCPYCGAKLTRSELTGKKSDLFRNFSLLWVE